MLVRLIGRGRSCASLALGGSPFKISLSPLESEGNLPGLEPLVSLGKNTKIVKTRLKRFAERVLQPDAHGLTPAFPPAQIWAFCAFKGALRRPQTW